MENLLPENWNKFSDAELKDSLLPSLREQGLAVAEEIVDGSPTADQLAAIDAHVEAAEQVKAELARRANELVEAEARREALSSALAALENQASEDTEEITDTVEDTSGELSTDEADAEETGELSTEDADAETVATEEDASQELEVEAPAEEATEEVVEAAVETEVESELSEEATEEVVEAVEEALETEEVAEEVAAEEVAEEVVTEELSDEASEEKTEDEAVVELSDEDETNADAEVIAEESSEELEVSAEEVTEEAADESAEITELSAEEVQDQEIDMEETNEGAQAPEFFVSSANEAPGRVTASMGAVTKQSGEAFSNTLELATEALEQFRKHGGERRWANVAGSEKINFATTTYGAQDKPMLSPMNEVHNTSMLDSIVGDFAEATQHQVDVDGEALVASGGICVPFEQDYSFFRLAQPQSFVEQCLPSVAAPRGGLKFLLPTDFKHARQGITTVSCQEDAAGYESTPESCGGPGTTPDKPCVCVECPEVAECCTTAIPWCVRWGNFNYYTFPELVENFMRDLQVAYAKVKETFYLDSIMANSTVVTGANAYSAVRDVLWDLRVASVNYRKRHNMNIDAVLQVMAPHWIVDVIKQDFANSAYCGDPLAYLNISTEQIAAALRSIGIQLCLYYDTPTILPAGVPSQAFDQDQAEGPLNQFPAKAVMFMFAPGTFIRLDGMNLDFGLIRDSSLVGTNDFIMAAEEFSGVCVRGFESLAIVSTVCPSGSGALGSAPVCEKA